jgi:hypothetical protein
MPKHIMFVFETDNTFSIKTRTRTRRKQITKENQLSNRNIK